MCIRDSCCLIIIFWLSSLIYCYCFSHIVASCVVNSLELNISYTALCVQATAIDFLFFFISNYSVISSIPFYATISGELEIVILPRDARVNQEPAASSSGLRSEIGLAIITLLPTDWNTQHNMTCVSAYKNWIIKLSLAHPLITIYLFVTYSKSVNDRWHNCYRIGPSPPIQHCLQIWDIKDQKQITNWG